MGIDLGVKELAVVSYNGNPIVFHNINKSRRMKTLVSKLKHLQRIQCRKYRANSDNNGVNKSKSIIEHKKITAGEIWKRRQIKDKLAEDKGIRLIHILEYDWDKNSEIIKENIINILK